MNATESAFMFTARHTAYSMVFVLFPAWKSTVKCPSLTPEIEMFTKFSGASVCVSPFSQETAKKIEAAPIRNDKAGRFLKYPPPGEFFNCFHTVMCFELLCKDKFLFHSKKHSRFTRACVNAGVSYVCGSRTRTNQNGRSSSSGSDRSSMVGAGMVLAASGLEALALLPIVFAPMPDVEYC